MDKLYINKNIRLFKNTVYIDKESIFSVPADESFSFFTKSLYKQLEINYSKFYKMDALSKLGFLAAELLLLETKRENILPEEIAIIAANSSSSLHTDVNYQKTIMEISSPSVFVYTLPNIVLGEICIRHNIKGESLFFIQENFDSPFFNQYVNYLFENNEIKLCIAGWIEINTEEEYLAELFLISKNVSNLAMTTNLNVNY